MGLRHPLRGKQRIHVFLLFVCVLRSSSGLLNCWGRYLGFVCSQFMKNNLFVTTDPTSKSRVVNRLNGII